MNWLSGLKKAVDFMEAHLLENISADDVAKECAISSFYLQKGFAIITGCSMGEYMRNRRLYKAAMDLKSTDEKIIDIAFKYGYETPESFTKAFSRFHGCTPIEARTAGKTIKVFVPLHFQISIQGGNEMNCRIDKMDSFKVIGFKRQFNMETSYTEIPKYWDEMNGIYGKKLWLEKKAPETEAEKAFLKYHVGMFGACIDGENKCGNFDYMIAGPYTEENAESKESSVPPEMSVYEFAASEWVKFPCTLKTLQDVNTKIFKEWLPANEDFEIAYSANIEWYDPESAPGPEMNCEIWIPVKRK